VRSVATIEKLFTSQLQWPTRRRVTDWRADYLQLRQPSAGNLRTAFEYSGYNRRGNGGGMNKRCTLENYKYG
jgi:hypothetical protein